MQNEPKYPMSQGISNPCEIKKRFHGTGDEGKND